MLFDVLRNTVLAGIGVQESLKKMIDELVKKGEISSSEGTKLIKEWSEKTAKKGAEIFNISEILNKALEKMNLPTLEDIEKLNSKINALSARVSRLEEDKAALDKDKSS
ncbi:MAG: hypothetical protein L3V56_08110 [Candidatus Magnetoovum sp. WYHC-5]|nr:hypothetical protein [Candidatus Magnetoovum sp. WYHC-5]